MATSQLEPLVDERATASAVGTAKARSETLEDYTLRFAPRSYRRWAPGIVATSALGGIAYLADFSIGANVGIQHGTTNAILGILVAAGPDRGWAHVSSRQNSWMRMQASVRLAVSVA